MRLTRSLLFSLSLCVSVFGQSSSPDDRAITDPQSISSITNPAARPVPIDDLYYTRSVFDPAWSPSGKEIVFVSDLAGRLNIWKVNSSGAWPIQLTQSDERQFSPVWSPDGKWIVYQQDSGGNELWDLYAVPGDGGEVVNLTNTPDAREEGPLWSHDGMSVALTFKPKDSTIYDIELLDWQTRKVRKLTNETTKTYSWSPVAWSADGRYLFANRSEVSGVPEGDVYRIEVETGKTENLTAHGGKRLYAATSLSPDSKTLLITSDEKGGYQNVAVLDVATKTRTWATDTKWEAGSGNFSPDGKSFTYTINADGRIDAYIASSADKHAEKVALARGLNTFSGNPSPYAPDGN